MIRFAVLLLAFAACSLRDPPTASPAQPLPAEPPLTLATMQIECDAMLAALAEYRTCTNLDENEAESVESWIETANRNFTAGRKVEIEPNAQTAIAGACHRATASVKAAHERCRNGPRPKR